jgi:hypothetical protein
MAVALEHRWCHRGLGLQGQARGAGSGVCQRATPSHTLQESKTGATLRGASQGCTDAWVRWRPRRWHGRTGARMAVAHDRQQGSPDLARCGATTLPRSQTCTDGVRRVPAVCTRVDTWCPGLCSTGTGSHPRWESGCMACTRERRVQGAHLGAPWPHGCGGPPVRGTPFCRSGADNVRGACKGSSLILTERPRQNDRPACRARQVGHYIYWSLHLLYL